MERADLKPMHGVRFAVMATVLAGAILPTQARGAETTISTAATAAASTSASCTDRPLGGLGVYREGFTASSLAGLTATLSGGHGDWDLAVFSARSRDAVAGSAYTGSDEVAAGYAFAGERLIVQVCRLPGASGAPHLKVVLEPILREHAGPAPALLRVAVADDADIAALQASGLDLAASGGPDYADVVSHGQGDEDTLATLGLPFVTQVEDLTALSTADRRRDARATDGAAAGFPSGRTGTYRRLFDYSAEMKQLAASYPRLVSVFTLPERTYEGRPVQGIEISTQVRRADDGKPVFMQLGVHHAREWPSGEHAIEWAYELINGYRNGEPAAVRLVRKTRTIVVPIVNPDGFNASREAGELEGGAGGRGGEASQETINVISHPLEYKRKNCRFADDSEGGSCTQSTNSAEEPGVDPNRNYGVFWGGPGASTNPLAADYRGPGPFSEPETRNVRSLMSRNQVTAYITNHTFGGLVLRPPGISTKGTPVDGKLLNRLGKRMVGENGYQNLPGYGLYERTGTTEDWAYFATGALGYTFEIGVSNFHPPYAETIAEWNGSSGPPGAGGNRAAYYRLASFVAKRASHATLAGRAPKRGTVTIRKSFRSPTSPVLNLDGEAGAVRRFTDRLSASVHVRRSGRFHFSMNPSTRPLVAKASGREATGPPSDPIGFSGSPADATLCLDASTEDPSCWNDHPFTVPKTRGRDNDSAAVRIEWATAASDWDFKVFRDSDGDANSQGEQTPVAVSTQGGSRFEQATVGGGDLVEGGHYVVRVINFLAAEPYEGTVTFAGPSPRVEAKRERWTVTCRTRAGRVTGKRKLYIERGERKHLDLRTGC